MSSGQTLGRSAAKVELRDIVVRFGAVLAADRVSLAMEPGEIVALLGPSGCGKTTTLRVVAGLQKADAGALRFQDQDVLDVPPHRRNVGMVFQNYALFPHMTVRENALFGLAMHRVPKPERERRVARTLEFLQLGDLANAFPDELSGGQQQRAALGRTLIVEPAVLLLDEPLSALDRQLRDAMRTELRSMLKAINITTLIVTHDQDEALTLADRVAVMQRGRIEQIGAPATIYERPATRFVANFVGQSNQLRGRVEEIDGGHALVRIGPEVTIRVVGAGACAVGRNVDVTIRPEAIAMLEPEASRPAGWNEAFAVLERTVFLGGVSTYHLKLPDGDPIAVTQTPNARLNGSPALKVGGEVRLAWPVESAVMLDEQRESRSA